MKKGIIISALLFSLLVLSIMSFAQSDKAGFEKMIKRKIFKQDRVGRIEGHQLPIPERGIPENNITSSNSQKEGEVHAAINPTDSSNIVIACMSHDARGNARISSYFSESFGSGWRKSSLSDLPTPSAIVYGGGDPVVTFDPFGKAYLCWIYYYKKSASSTRAYWEIFWAESTDNGRTWIRMNNYQDRASSGEVDYNSLKIYSGIIPDKPWIASNNNGDLIMTCTGWDMQYKTNVFQFIKYFGKTAFEKRANLVSVAGVNERNHSTMAVNSSGTIYSVFANYKNAINRSGLTYYVAGKSSSASHFSAPSEISEAQIPLLSNGQTSSMDKAYLAGLNLSRLYGNQQLAIDNSNGIFKNNMYLVWNANGIKSKLGNGLDIYLSTSTDGGASWSPAKIINQDVKGIDIAQHHPTIFVNEKGYVFIAWYDRRNSHNNQSSEFYLAISKNGGQFFREIKVTTQATSFDPQLKGTFHIGEYVQVLASDQYAMPIWIDGRNPNNDFDVFVASIDAHNPLGVVRLSSVHNPIKLHGVYPNPGNGIYKLRIQTNKSLSVRIYVSDLAGRVVNEASNSHMLFNGTSNFKLDISDLASGVYLLHLVSEGGELIEQIVKN